MSKHVEYHVAQSGKIAQGKPAVVELTRSAERGPVTGSRIVASVYDEDDAQRIVQCLEACSGIPAEALTQQSLAAAYVHMSHQRDRLQVALQAAASRLLGPNGVFEAQGVAIDLKRLLVELRGEPA